MMTIDKILFPTDFTYRAEQAFAHAAELAEMFDAELHVLNVILASARSTDDPMMHLPLEKESDDTWSDAFRLQGKDGTRLIHAQIRIASPAEGIIQYAERHDIDLILMATHGRRGLDHFLLGSVAEEVVRTAPCPVITIRQQTEKRELGEWKRILVPIDFSESSVMSVTHAKELAAFHGARLDLLHVIEEAVFPTIYGVDPVAVAVPEVIERSKESLEEVMSTAQGPDAPFACHVVVGHPVHEILEFAEQNASDLITIATHGLTGLSRVLIGSVTERVVRQATFPVLTLKSFGKGLVKTETAAASTSVRAV